MCVCVGGGEGVGAGGGGVGVGGAGVIEVEISALVGMKALMSKRNYKTGICVEGLPVDTEFFSQSFPLRVKHLNLKLPD